MQGEENDFLGMAAVKKSSPANRQGRILSDLCDMASVTRSHFIYALIIIPIGLCIVPPPKAGEQYERTAILYLSNTHKNGSYNLVKVLLS